MSEVMVRWVARLWTLCKEIQSQQYKSSMYTNLQMITWIVATCVLCSVRITFQMNIWSTYSQNVDLLLRKYVCTTSRLRTVHLTWWWTGGLFGQHCQWFILYIFICNLYRNELAVFFTPNIVISVTFQNRKFHEGPELLIVYAFQYDKFEISEHRVCSKNALFYYFLLFSSLFSSIVKCALY